MSRQVKWIFFDVGNVLFNDDRQNYFAYYFLWQRLTQEGHLLTFSDLLNERERRAARGENWITRKILSEHLNEQQVAEWFADLKQNLHENFDDNHLFQHGLIEILQELQLSYQLGIIANQPEECRHSLKRRGLDDFFKVIAISEELNLFKPDVALYQWAIDQAAIDPSQTIMVGDRIDNDVAPAQQIGMKTIHIQWTNQTQKVWQPEEETAQQFLESLDRLPLFSAAMTEPAADQQVDHFQQIPEAVAKLG